jgi:hypothetical protein
MSLAFLFTTVTGVTKRYRALFRTGNAWSIANHLFRLSFSQGVTAVTGVTEVSGIFARQFGIWPNRGHHRP